jgi:undecaprenyl-diphosphatase
MIIGIAQTFALIPGVSRSGASIIGGLQAGLTRKAATQFSFYLAVPTLGGTILIELLDMISANDLAYLLLGSSSSCWFSLKFSGPDPKRSSGV